MLNGVAHTYNPTIWEVAASLNADLATYWVPEQLKYRVENCVITKQEGQKKIKREKGEGTKKGQRKGRNEGERSTQKWEQTNNPTIASTWMDYLFLKAKWFRKSGSGGEKVHFRALAPGQVIKVFALNFFIILWAKGKSIPSYQPPGQKTLASWAKSNWHGLSDFQAATIGLCLPWG